MFVQMPAEDDDISHIFMRYEDSSDSISFVCVTKKLCSMPVYLSLNGISFYITAVILFMAKTSTGAGPAIQTSASK
jgi:hypothetical protein